MARKRSAATADVSSAPTPDPPDTPDTPDTPNPFKGLDRGQYTGAAQSFIDDNATKVEATLSSIFAHADNADTLNVETLLLAIRAGRAAWGPEDKPEGDVEDGKKKTFKDIQAFLTTRLFNGHCERVGVDPAKVGKGKEIPNRKSVPGWSSIPVQVSGSFTIVAAPADKVSVEDMLAAAGVDSTLTPMPDGPVPGLWAKLLAAARGTGRTPAPKATVDVFKLDGPAFVEKIVGFNGAKMGGEASFSALSWLAAVGASITTYLEANAPEEEEEEEEDAS